jgi:hypothetical protein
LFINPIDIHRKGALAQNVFSPERSIEETKTQMQHDLKNARASGRKIHATGVPGERTYEETVLLL